MEVLAASRVRSREGDVETGVSLQLGKCRRREKGPSERETLQEGGSSRAEGAHR